MGFQNEVVVFIEEQIIKVCSQYRLLQSFLIKFKSCDKRIY